jgi:hypothetical protein
MPEPGRSLRRPVRSLTAALQMLDQTALNVVLDLTVDAGRVSEGKVIDPAFQMPIQLSDERRNRLKTLMTVSHLVQLLPLPPDRLLRRKHIQVFLCASFQIAILPKRVSQKVQARPWFPQIHNPGLVPIDL